MRPPVFEPSAPCLELLDIGFSPVSGRNELARQRKKDPKSITRVRMVVARAFELCWQWFLNFLAVFMTTTKPAVFAVGICYDETKERLTLPLESLERGVAKNTLNVFVVSERYQWCFGSMATSAPGLQTFSMNLKRPPVPVVSTPAESFVEGLRDMPQVRAHAEYQMAGLVNATLGIYHVDRDGHFGGAKVAATEFHALTSHCLVSDLECGNHANNLTENSAVDCLSVGFDYVNWMYESGSFLQMGSHSARLVFSVDKLVERFYPCPILGRPLDLDLAHRHAQELSALHVYNHKIFKEDFNAGDTLHDAGPGSLRFLAYRKAWQDFLGIFNYWVAHAPGQSLQAHWSESPLSRAASILHFKASLFDGMSSKIWIGWLG